MITMRRTILAAAFASALIASGSTGAATVPKLGGCVPGSTPSVRPKQIIVACGDANFFFTQLVWSAWNAGQANASGTANVNDCKPYCAAGHFHTYRVTVTLTRPKSCPGGVREWGRLAWAFTGKVPASQARRSSQSLPCR